jgi:hypothetical protein
VKKFSRPRSDIFCLLVVRFGDASALDLFCDSQEVQIKTPTTISIEAEVFLVLKEGFGSSLADESEKGI